MGGSSTTNEHRTVALAIAASLATAGIVFAAILVTSGGSVWSLSQTYVLPLVIASVSLSIFMLLLWIRQRLGEP